MTIYLDNAATSFPKAPGVGEAISRFAETAAANPGRGGHTMATRAEALVADVRLRLARRLGVDQARWVVFTLNTTDALNLGIKGVVDAAEGKPHVVTTTIEHNSVTRPLMTLERAGRITLSRVAADAVGRVHPDAIGEALRPETRLVAMTHASNVLGTLQDIAAVGERVREHGALFLVDAAQTAGSVPIDMKTLPVDLLALPGHKALLGPTGTGALCVGPRAEPLGTWREGGTGTDSADPYQPEALPQRLEAGTVNTFGLAGLARSLEYLDTQPEDATLKHEQALVARFREQAAAIAGVNLYGDPDPAASVGVVAFNVAGFPCDEAAAVLDSTFDIAVRAGLHCSPGVHQLLGTFPEGTLRMSVGPANTAADIDALLDALRQLAAV